MKKNNSYALMQPTFLPWLGWFALLEYVDEFIIFDNAQFSRQSWHHRNQIKTANGGLMLHVPVKHDGDYQVINQTKLADPRKLKKLLSAISQSYSKSDYFDELFPSFSKVFSDGIQTGSLFEFNLGIISWCAQVLDISTPITLSSALDVAGARGEYVANIGQSVGLFDYISPIGAREYLTEDKQYFDQQNISINYLLFDHPIYQQKYGEFLSHCCILDLLFNEGSASLDIIRKGIRIESHDNLLLS